MHKNILAKLLATILGLVIIVAGFIISINVGKEELPDEPVIITDANKFKKDYESYNGESVGDNVFREVNIPEDNPIVYSSVKEIESILDGKSGIIYLGYPTCPWCRNAIETLISVAKSRNIDKIYYVDIHDMRSSFEVLDGNLKINKGTDDYYKLLELLDNYLEEYEFEYEGITYPTGEKRIYAPTVIFIKDGNIIGLHVGTTDLDENQSPFDVITNKQKETLSKIYGDYMDEIYKTYCDAAC